MVQKARTKLDQERNLVQQKGEILEYLDAVGQDDEEKAAKCVIEVENQKAKEVKEEECKKIEALETARKFKRKDYVHKLAEMMYKMAQFVDIPKNYIYRINFSEDKLNIIVKSPSGKLFGRGIKPNGEIKYDYQAIETLLMQCENTIDKLEKRGQYREDGLILPNGIK